MTHRSIAFIGLAACVVALVAVVPIHLAGQAQAGGTKPAPVAKAWMGAKTADGQPDLQGTWLNFDSTPFETPSASRRGGGAATASEAGPAAAGRGAAAGGGRAAAAANAGGGGGATGGRAGAAAGGGGGGFGFFQDHPSLVDRRTSLVVDPPDGKVPVMASAEQKRDYNLAHVNDSWENNTTWERCITREVPGGMFPTGYDSAYQIVQGPGTVAILYEMIHEPRIIPVDGSPHLPQNIRLWNGDSRGHWEGNTLVVDITNYNDKGVIANNQGAGRIRGIPHSADLHVIERFTRVSDKTINYEVTIDDPKVYTRPWTLAMPLTQDNSYQIYEYACHEGNRDYMEVTLGGGRVQDRAAGEGSRSK